VTGSPDPQRRVARVVLVATGSHPRDAADERADALRRRGVDVEVVRGSEGERAAGRYGTLARRVAGGVATGLRGRLPRLPDPLDRLRLEAPAPGRTVVEAHPLHPGGLVALPIARSIGAPLVLVADSSDAAALAGTGVDVAAARLSRDAADLVIAGSRTVARAVRGTDAGGRNGTGRGPRVEVVLDGVDHHTFARARDRAGADGILRSGVIMVSPTDPARLDMALDALGRLSQHPTLTVVGAAATAEPTERELGNRVDVRRMPATDDARLAAEVACRSVMLAFGLADALAGMAAGAVTVVGPETELAELVDDGRTGVVAAGSDADGWARAIGRALRIADTPERAGPVRMAADAVAARHDNGRALDRTLDLYDELLA